MIKPYQHQLDGLDKVKDLPSFALFMEQGTGKTKLTFMVALANKHKIDAVLVIAPNGVHEQWITEQAPLHYDGEYEGLVWENKKTQKAKKEFRKFLASDKMKILAVNVEAFSSDGLVRDKNFMEFMTNDLMIVVDESTRIKGPKAKRTKRIMELGKKGRIKCILTGTPTPNSPFDLWSQFEFLCPGYWKMNYFSFQHFYGILCRDTNPVNKKMYHKVLDEKTYNIVKSAIKREGELTYDLMTRLSARVNTSTENIQHIANMKEFTPYRNLDKLQARISEITYKVKKDDCLDLPPKVYEKIYVDLTPEQKRVIKELKDTQISSYKDKDTEILYKLTLTLRLQQIAGGCFPYMEDVDVNDPGSNKTRLERFDKNPKLNALLGDLDEVENTTQIIVWANFVEELKLIHEALDKINESNALYYGETTTDIRKQVLDDFKNGRIRILIANRTAAEGLNLQCATLHYFYSNGWYGDKREQAEDRSHRTGQNQTVVYKDLIAKSTMDETLYKVLRDKINLCDYFRRS